GGHRGAGVARGTGAVGEETRDRAGHRRDLALELARVSAQWLGPAARGTLRLGARAVRPAGVAGDGTLAGARPDIAAVAASARARRRRVLHHRSPPGAARGHRTELARARLPVGRRGPLPPWRTLFQRSGVQGLRAAEDRGTRVSDPAQPGRPGERSRRGLRRADLQATQSGVLSALTDPGTAYGASGQLLLHRVEPLREHAVAARQDARGARVGDVERGAHALDRLREVRLDRLGDHELRLAAHLQADADVVPEAADLRRRKEAVHQADVPEHRAADR